MMVKRLKVFRFHKKIENPDRTLKPCAHCFAVLLLVPDAPDPVAGFGKPERPRPPTGETPPAKRGARSKVKEWTVEDVASYLERLALGQLEEKFRENGVDGEMLSEMPVEV